MIAPFKGDYDDRIFERCIHELPSVSYAFLSSGSYHVAPGAIEPGTACFPAGRAEALPAASFLASFAHQESTLPAGTSNAATCQHASEQQPREVALRQQEPV